MNRMRVVRVVPVVMLTATLGACAAKAQARTEVELPLLEPPPPPPRVVAAYAEPEPPPVAPSVEAAAPAKPPARPTRAEHRPEPIPPAEPVGAAARPSNAPSLTLIPTPGAESQTVSAIRDLMGRAAKDLSRVNTNALNADGRSQFETARRFLEQAEEALKIPNIVFAGRLADKAATMAAILVR